MTINDFQPNFNHVVMHIIRRQTQTYRAIVLEAHCQPVVTIAHKKSKTHVIYTATVQIRITRHYDNIPFAKRVSLNNNLVSLRDIKCPVDFCGIRTFQTRRTHTRETITVIINRKPRAVQNDIQRRQSLVRKYYYY